jgi:DNA-binding beta-propeller fold protein YncE
MLFRLTIVLGWVLFFAGCRHTPDTPQTPADTGYPEPVEAVFRRANCLLCHGAEAQGGLNMATWQNLMNGYANQASIIPYRAKESHLLWHSNSYPSLGPVARPPMPPVWDGNQWQLDSARKLTEADVRLLRDWVAAGAPNRTGQTRWQTRTQVPNGKWFFLCQGDDFLGVLDTETRLVMAYQDVGTVPDLAEAPHFITLSPDKQAVYLTLLNGGLVEKYSTRDYSLLGGSPFLGDSPAHVKASSNGKWLLVTHWSTSASLGSRRLTLLDAVTLQPVDWLNAPWGERPHGLAVNKAFTKAYVTSETGNYFTVVGINPETGRFLTGPFDQQDVPLEPGLLPGPSTGYQPYQAILNQDETRLYVSAWKNNTVYVYDVASAQPVLLHAIRGSSEACPQGLGSSPKLMELHDDRLYVVCQTTSCTTSPNRTRQGCVSVFDVSGNQPVWRTNIYGLGHRPHGLSIDPIHRLLWVTCENQGSGSEPAHHFVEGNQAPGLIMPVSLETLQPLYSRAVEVGVFPSAAVLAP